MKMRGNITIWALIGILGATVLGLTGDEILRSVYDSSNTALRTNLVAGGVTPAGSTNAIQYNNAGAFGGTGPGSSGQVLTSNGAGSAPTFQANSGGISGLTTNTIPKATSATAIGNSSLSDDGTNVTSTEPILAPATLDAQLYSFTGDPDTGIGRGAANNLRLYAGGVLAFACNATNCSVNAPSGLVLNTLKIDIANEDITFTRNAAGELQLADDAAIPIAITVKGPDGSGADKTGGSMTFAAGQSTGAGIGGDVVTQTSPSTATSSTINPRGDRSRVLAKYTTLTETVATAFARVAVASGTVVGGEIVVTVEANDATDFQARTLRFGFSAVNKAGTTTAVVGAVDETVAVSAGTLTCTITAADATNNVDFKANCTSSLTQTVLRANAVVTAKNFGVGAISAQ